MNGYRNLGTYYGGYVEAMFDPDARDFWHGEFDERTVGDAAAADWVRSHGMTGHSAVVWSNDAWPYLLADLPLMLPTPPIYNDMTLLGQNGQVAARVREINPEIIVAADDATLQFPEVSSVLRGYRLVASESHVSVWLRQDVDVPPLTSS